MRGSAQIILIFKVVALVILEPNPWTAVLEAYMGIVCVEANVEKICGGYVPLCDESLRIENIGVKAAVSYEFQR